MRHARTQAPPNPPKLASEAPSAGNVAPTGGSQGWRKLVAWPLDDAWLARRHIPHWAWSFFHSERVLLRPALGPDGKSTRVAVVAETLKGTTFRFVKHSEPGDVNGDEVLITRMRVHWWDPSVGSAGAFMSEETDVHHALALRYVTVELPSIFLVRRLEDSIWDYTREHPDAPFVRQPGPPQLLADITNPVRERPRQSRAYDFDFAGE